MAELLQRHELTVVTAGGRRTALRFIGTTEHAVLRCSQGRQRIINERPGEKANRWFAFSPSL
jgi:hypothetical protein